MELYKAAVNAVDALGPITKEACDFSAFGLCFMASIVGWIAPAVAVIWLVLRIPKLYLETMLKWKEYKALRRENKKYKK